MEKKTNVQKKKNIARGARSVAVGGDVENSQILTGDIYIDLQRQVGAATLNILDTKIGHLSSELSKKIAIELEELRERFRQGDYDEAFKGVHRLKEAPSWDALEAPLRASILSALAGMTIGLEGVEGLDDAKMLASEALKMDPAFDDRGLQARIMIAEKGFLANAEILSQYDTTESYNLWLAYLLNAGKVDELLELRTSPPVSIGFNAETHRLYALGLLAAKNINEAQREIAKAKGESANWVYVRYTAAIINYFSALSPTALLPYLVQSPKPILFEWVKIDDDSQKNLREAASEFQGLSKQAKPGSSEQLESEVWHFACLANLIDGYNDAIEVATAILKRDPNNLPILSWFLIRGYDYDFGESLRSLEQKESSDHVSVDVIVGLIGIHLRLGGNETALQIIQRRREVFEAANSIDLWRYWRAQVLMKLDRYDEAEEEVGEIVDEEISRLSETTLFQFRGEKDGNWKPFIKFLSERYRLVDDQESFLSLYETKVQVTRDKRFIAYGADKYCDLMQTAGAAAFVINAVWNIGRYEKCLELCNKYSPFFPKAKLPSNLRRLKIQCLKGVDIRQALSEAESLALEDSSFENAALLIDIYLSKGDLPALQVIARKLLQRTDVSVTDLFRIAHIVQLKDRALAEKFWLRAMEVGVPEDPDVVVFAHTIASKLGLEDQGRNLMGRMMQQAHEGKGPMKAFTFRSALKLMERRASALNELFRKYNTAELPLHIFAKEKNITLAELLIRIADKSSENPRVQERFRLFTRHGARVLGEGNDYSKATNWRVNLDVTTLLIAHKLRLLPALEQLFRPLRISRHIVKSLIEQKDALAPHQKSRLDSSKILIELFLRNKFSVVSEGPNEETLSSIKQIAETAWKNRRGNKVPENKGSKLRHFVLLKPANLVTQLGDRLNVIAQSMTNNGIALGFLPLNCYGMKTHVSLQLPELLQKRVANGRAVLESLVSNQRISQDKYDKAVQALGVEGKILSEVEPELGTKLFLMSGVEDLLAGAGFLEDVCNNFDVFVTQESIDSAKTTINHYSELEILGKSVEELIDRVSAGLDDGSYEFINISDKKSKEHKVSSARLGEATASTMDLLLFEPKQGDIVCIDDRALTKHAIRHENGITVPLIGINELLMALWKNKLLDEHEYYDHLLTLRKGNYRYIPISANEIIFHLNQARVEDGVLVESEALAILSEYFASCLLDKEFLQIIDSTHFSEIPFIIFGNSATIDAIVSVWKDETQSPDTSRLFADWIFENLYTGNFGCSHLRNETALKDKRFDKAMLLTLDVCNLLMRGMLLNTIVIPPTKQKARSRYFNWLTDRVITTRCIGSPGMVGRIANAVKDSFKVIHDREVAESEEHFVAGFIMGQFFLELPEIIRDEIDFDSEVKDWLRIKVQSMANVAGVDFAAEKYWSAVEDAVNGAGSTRAVSESGDEYTFSRKRERKLPKNSEHFPVVEMFDSTGAKIRTLEESTLGLLADNIEVRLRVMKEFRRLFDCANEKFEEIALDLVSEPDSIKRLTRFHDIQRLSTDSFYRTLEQRFREGQRVPWKELMPPSVEGLAGYYRLSKSSDSTVMSEILERSAKILLEEESVLGSISRFANLPIQMPSELIERFLKCSKKEKLEILRQISRTWASPVRLLHAANLAARSLTSSSTEIRKVLTDVLNRLFTNEGSKEDFAAFHATLTFVSEEFDSWVDGSNVCSEITLALMWAHTSALYHVQRALGLDAPTVVKMLSTRRHANVYETLERNGQIWFDCLNPRRVNRTIFLTHAAAKVFNGIDRETLESLAIPNLIRSEMFPETEGIKFPAITLLGDPLLCDDKLDSIFGGDRFEALSAVIGPDGIEVLKTEYLRQTVKTYLEEVLNDSTKLRLWPLIYVICSDLPIYEDLRELCLAALNGFRLDGLLANEERPGFIFLAAANQVSSLADSTLTKSFREFVLRLIRQVEESTTDNDKIELRSMLIDSVMALSTSPNPVTANEMFIETLESISDAWKDFKSIFGYVLMDVAWNKSVDLSMPWWHFNLKMRAEPQRLT